MPRRISPALLHRFGAFVHSGGFSGVLGGGVRDGTDG